MGIERGQSPTEAPTRFKLALKRLSHTHHFDIGSDDKNTRGYVTAGMYDDGRIGDIFVFVSKEGSTLSGMIRAWSMSVSIGLQYGIPISVFVERFRYMNFEPNGWTKTKDIPQASSIVDYIFNWIEREFPNGVWKGIKR